MFGGCRFRGFYFDKINVDGSLVGLVLGLRFGMAFVIVGNGAFVSDTMRAIYRSPPD